MSEEKKPESRSVRLMKQKRNKQKKINSVASSSIRYFVRLVLRESQSVTIDDLIGGLMKTMFSFVVDDVKEILFSVYGTLDIDKIKEIDGPESPFKNTKRKFVVVDGIPQEVKGRIKKVKKVYEVSDETKKRRKFQSKYMKEHKFVKGDDRRKYMNDMWAEWNQKKN